MWPGTLEGNNPIYDHKTTISAVTDGMSTTVALTENIRAGASINSPLRPGRHRCQRQPVGHQLGLRPPELRRLHGLGQRLHRGDGRSRAPARPSATSARSADGHRQGRRRPGLGAGEPGSSTSENIGYGRTGRDRGRPPVPEQPAPGRVRLSSCATARPRSSARRSTARSGRSSSPPPARTCSPASIQAVAGRLRRHRPVTPGVDLTADAPSHPPNRDEDPEAREDPRSSGSFCR